MKTANLAIVFTDIKGFTERAGRQSLEQNQALLQTHKGLLGPVFRAFQGKIIKEIGDAYLVTFESPTLAVLAGVAVQDTLWAHNRGKQEHERLDVRVAINCGEVRLQSDDVFGEPVNIAAQIQALADSPEVYLTESVYLAMNKAEVPSEEVGLFDLKGIPGQIRVFRVPHAPAGEAPPYGNLGLSKMAGTPASELTARAVELTAKAMHGGEVLVKRAVQELSSLDRARSKAFLQRARPVAIGLAALLLVISAVRWLATSSLERAVVAVETSAPDQKSAKVEAALKLLAEEKNLGTQQYWSGRLQEARDDTGAVRHYKSAIQQGSGAAEDRLISLLDHRRCEWRVTALWAVGDLKLKSAKSRVEALAEKGGADDVQKVLFLGCNSRSDAAAVLRKLE